MQKRHVAKHKPENISCQNTGGTPTSPSGAAMKIGGLAENPLFCADFRSHFMRQKEAWNRFFPHSSLMKPTLPTP